MKDTPGQLSMQVCATCGRVQYPQRDACVACLSTELEHRLVSSEGELIAETTLLHSHEQYFRERLPWRVALVRLDAGCSVIAHRHAACGAPPSRVQVVACHDPFDRTVLVALPVRARYAQAEDGAVRDLESILASEA
ncbi:MAG: Zn-ribbon domain-containing OB-fold protein [Steroidobacterales bacterium]